MDIEEISKVFLTAYRDIPRMIKSLDKCVDHAVMSGFGCSHLYNGLTTDMLYEKIIVFKNRQDILATVYELTKEILSKMNKNYSKLLVAKYIKNLTFNEIAKKYNISVRSVFRYIKKAINEFCYYLKVKGYSSSEWLEGELFLENIYENIKREEEREKAYIKRTELKNKVEQNVKKAVLTKVILTESSNNFRAVN